MANIENLDQIRARNAWNACNGRTFSNADGGEVVKKLSPMIRENGMLGALAFALDKAEKADKEKNTKPEEKEKKKGFFYAFNAICEHLKIIGKTEANNAKSLLEELLKCDSLKLRDVTAETMLYLDYLRRFGKKEEESKK